MINKKLFEHLKEKHEDFVRSRRMLIKETSDILSASKQAIFAYHRSDKKEGDKLVREAKKGLKSIDIRFIQKDKTLLQQGSLKAAQEEFIEALFFGLVLDNKKLDLVKDVEINFESYFGGLCDLTGELVRKSVNLVSAGKMKDIKRFRNITEEIIKELIKFNLVGQLRVKYDQARNNLRKMEDIAYDIKIKRNK
jgi:predicted translin family RNA/ssDNA-binding protein